MADDFNMRPHDQMWQGFAKLLTVSGVGIVVLLIFMAIFLT